MHQAICRFSSGPYNRIHPVLFQPTQHGLDCQLLAVHPSDQSCRPTCPANCRPALPAVFLLPQCAHLPATILRFAVPHCLSSAGPCRPTRVLACLQCVQTPNRHRGTQQRENRPSRRESPSVRRIVDHQSRDTGSRCLKNGPRRRAFERMHEPKSPFRPVVRGPAHGCLADRIRFPRQSSGLLRHHPSGRSGELFRRRIRQSTGFCQGDFRYPKLHRWPLPECAGWSGNSVPVERPLHPENPFQTSGCCPLRPRASRKLTGRRPPHNRCFYAHLPTSAAIGIGRRWYLDTRPPECI